MQVEIEVRLAIERALQQSDQLWQNLERARATASQISVQAANIRIPTVTGGGTVSGGSSSTGSTASNTAAMNALAAAIARQRASAATAQAATVSLNNAIGASVAASNAAAQAITALANAQARQTANAGQGATAQQTQTATMNGLIGGTLRLAASYVSLRAAWNFASDSIGQSIAVENLTNTLTATSGSALQAASDIAFLRAEADRIGVSFIGSTDSFVKFSVAVKGAGMSGQFARDTFTALSEASRRLGLGVPQQSAVFLALEQMISKGVVSSQELRLQLGNALPGAFQTAARAMGLTTAELQKLVETGNLASTEFLPKFITQLQKELPATAETLASTSAELARLGNAWQEFKAKLGSNIPIKQGIESLSAVTEIASAMVDNRTAAEIKAGRDPRKVRRGQIAGDLTRGDTGFISGAENEDINRWMLLEDRLASQKASKQKRASEIANQISSDDTATESEVEKANKFWKIYRTLASDTLNEEENKRQDIVRKYADAIAKIRANSDNFSKPLIDTLVEQADKAQTVQLQQFDDKQAAERMKQIADQAKQLREETEKIRGLEIKLIPDEEEQKVARINREFDELRDKLLLFELGNPSAISGGWEARLEASRAAEISRLKPRKSPVEFLGQDFDSLQLQRRQLEADLPNSKTIEDFTLTSQRIQEVNQAMHLQMRANNVETWSAFKFGFDDVAVQFGTFSERMAQMGAQLAESLDRNMTDALSNIALATEDPKQAMAEMSRAIIAELTRMAIQALIVRPIIQGISGAFGGVFGGASPTPTFSAVPAGHGGMVVGMEGMTSQFTPRFHGGSGPVGDEQMAVLRRQEVVLTPDQLKAVGGSKGGQPLMLINLFDRKVFDQMRASNPDAVVNEIGQNKTLIRQLLQ